MRKSDYIYLSAKIRVLETRIPDKTDIERMINATNLNNAFLVLNDTDYRKNILGVEPENFREALADDLKRLNEFLQKNTPDRDLFKLMMLSRDFVNLKFFFKAKLFGVEVDDRVDKNAAYRTSHAKDLPFENRINYPEDMKAYISGQNRQSLDRDIKEVIQKTLKAVDENTRPDEVDAVLTRHYYDLCLALAEKIKSRFILDYYKLCIDTANLLILLRTRRLKLSKERLKPKLIQGGRIDVLKMTKAYPEDLSGLKPSVRVAFNKQTASAFNDFCENKKIFKAERVFENYKASYPKQIKRTAYGPEVIFAYYLAKINANANTGIILTGKINNIPIEEIRKTVRESY